MAAHTCLSPAATLKADYFVLPIVKQFPASMECIIRTFVPVFIINRTCVLIQEGKKSRSVNRREILNHKINKLRRSQHTLSGPIPEANLCFYAGFDIHEVTILAGYDAL
jgi:hypothetical protein